MAKLEDSRAKTPANYLLRVPIATKHFCLICRLEVATNSSGKNFSPGHCCCSAAKRESRLRASARFCYFGRSLGNIITSSKWTAKWLRRPRPAGAEIEEFFNLEIGGSNNERQHEIYQPMQKSANFLHRLEFLSLFCFVSRKTLRKVQFNQSADMESNCRYIIWLDDHSQCDLDNKEFEDGAVMLQFRSRFGLFESRAPVRGRPLTGARRRRRRLTTTSGHPKSFAVLSSLLCLEFVRVVVVLLK